MLCPLCGVSIKSKTRHYGSDDCIELVRAFGPVAGEPPSTRRTVRGLAPFSRGRKPSQRPPTGKPNGKPKPPRSPAPEDSDRPCLECGRPSVKGQRKCREHYRAYMRDYYQAHRPR